MVEGRAHMHPRDRTPERSRELATADASDQTRDRADEIVDKV
jgi:hypothetical protein